jgi:hypothetical protein
MKHLGSLTTLLLSFSLGCTVAPAAKNRGNAPKPAAPVAKRAPVAIAPTTTAAPEPTPSCPFSVPGLAISAENAHMGAALVFIGMGEPDGLREQIWAMADAHNRVHTAMGPLPGDEPTFAAERPGDEPPVVAKQPAEDGPIPVPEEPTAGEEPTAPAEEPGVATEEPADPDADLMNPYEKDEEEPTLASGGATARPAGDAASESDEDLTIVRTHSRARVDYVDKGARIVFTSDVDDVDALRAEVRNHASELREACSMGAEPATELVD